MQRMLLLMLLVGLRVVAAQETGCYAFAGDVTVNVRWGPGTQQYGILGSLDAGSSLSIIGKNGDWYAVAYDDAQGWVASWAVTAKGTCETLPILPQPDQPEAITQLMETPILPEMTQHTQEIFAQGQIAGSDPHAFTKVGDCNTASIFFLQGFDTGSYDLGPYEELQPTIDHFAGWFAHQSLTGRKGYSAHNMIDLTWANPELCEAGESPLECEYRRSRPAAAVMMFGSRDMMTLDAAQFEAAVRSIVALSIERGVVPILTTFTWTPDGRWRKSLEFNALLVKIAREYDIPLINFWRAARSLPNYGLIEDYTHLTDTTETFGYNIVFTEGEQPAGHTLRNLLTLQTLDLLRREVILAR